MSVVKKLSPLISYSRFVGIKESKGSLFSPTTAALKKICFRLVSSSQHDPVVQNLSENVDALFRSCDDCTQLQNHQSEAGFYSNLIKRLRDTAFESLKHISWLVIKLDEDSFITPYNQLLSINKLKYFMDPVISHSSFPDLLDKIQLHHFEMSNADLATTLLCLLQLSYQGPAVGKLWEQSIDRCPDMNIHDLSLLGGVLQLTNLFNTGSLNKPVLDRFLFLIDNGLLDAKCLDTALSYSKITINISFLLRGLAHLKALQILSDYMTEAVSVQNMELVVRILKSTWPSLFQKQQYNHILHNYEYIDITLQMIEGASDFLMKNMNLMNQNHVSHLTTTLNKCGMYKGQLADCLHERSLELLNLSRSITACIFILPAIRCNRTTIPIVCSHIRDHILPTFESESMDLITLTSIAKNFKFQSSFYVDMFDSMIDQVINNMPQLINFNFGIYSVIHFLLVCPSISHEHQHALLNSFERHLDHCNLHVHLPLVFGVLFKHLIPACPSGKIPHHFQEKLLAAMSRWTLFQIYHFLKGFGPQYKDYLYSDNLILRNQLTEVKRALFDVINNRLDLEGEHVVHPGLLVNMLSCMSPSSRDELLLKKTCDNFLSFETKVNISNIAALTREMHQKRYYHAGIYDMVADSMINHPDINNGAVFSTLACFGFTGHRPRDFDGFLRVVDSYYVDQEEKGLEYYARKIASVMYLCWMGHFPEDRISDIFTITSLEMAEEEMLLYSDRHKRLNRALLELNRIAVLNCPHLEIPWFHEEYCQDNLTPDDLSRKFSSDDVTQTISEVGEQLSKVLGGWQFLNYWVSTPYHYKIDFEFLLDGNGNLLRTSEVSSSDSDITRVAVLYRPYSQYRFRSKQLLGYQRLKLQHLKMMGYKVVEISIHDWPRRKDAKKFSYIERKISQSLAS